jgi:hypothetical protein
VTGKCNMVRHFVYSFFPSQQVLVEDRYPRQIQICPSMFMNLNQLQLETEYSQAILKIYSTIFTQNVFRRRDKSVFVFSKVSTSGPAHKMANQINSEPLPPWIYALSGSASVVLAQILLYPFDR